MTVCEACQAAEKNPQTGRYSAHCDGCKARAVAHGRKAFDASAAGKMTPEYKQVLQRVFGDDWEAGHLRVKAWQKRIKGAST